MQPRGRWSRKSHSSEAAMDTNPDFRDLLRSLSDAGVRYVIVGAYAVIYHTEPRYTKDLDIWVEPTEANAGRVWKALARFGAPLKGVKVEDFTDAETVYQIGVEPNRIDIITSIDGVAFTQAWARRVRAVYGEIPTYILAKSDLIRNKRAAGRLQDLLDLKRLTGRRPQCKGRTRRKRR